MNEELKWRYSGLWKEGRREGGGARRAYLLQVVQCLSVVAGISGVELQTRGEPNQQLHKLGHVHPFLPPALLPFLPAGGEEGGEEGGGGCLGEAGLESLCGVGGREVGR
jgi:hypothetical protein